jgi:hypothetical protein
MAVPAEVLAAALAEDGGRRSRPGAVPDYCFTVDGRRMLPGEMSSASSSASIADGRVRALLYRQKDTGGSRDTQCRRTGCRVCRVNVHTGHTGHTGTDGHTDHTDEPVKRHRGEPGHTRDTHGTPGAQGHTDHTDEPHNHPNPPTHNPHDSAKTGVRWWVGRCGWL